MVISMPTENTQEKTADQTITLTAEDGDQVELYVLEETEISGRHYLLLAEDPENDSEGYLFREERDTEDREGEAVYTPVTDAAEFDAVLKVFEELMEDTRFTESEA